MRELGGGGGEGSEEGVGKVGSRKREREVGFLQYTIKSPLLII